MTVAVGADIMADHRFLAFIIRLFYAGFAFSRRAPSRTSLAYVEAMITSGRHVLLAPEGHISVDGELNEFKAGVGLLAVRLGVPVVPLKIIGLRGTVPLHAKWPKRKSTVTVRIGEPLHFGAESDYRDATRAMHDAVASL
jgi:long-chain acyl-CoA synthetase